MAPCTSGWDHQPAPEPVVVTTAVFATDDRPAARSSGVARQAIP
jgi:hypothetical protein